MTNPGTSPQLDVYEIAYLAGGPDRVVDTALVALVETGRVRVHAPGELAVVEPGRSHPVEGAVMDAVGTQGHRSIDTIRWRLTGDERLLAVGRSLAAAGLLRRRRGIRRDPDRHAWVATEPGRRALLEARERPPTEHSLDGGSALVVALHGRQAMADAELRTAIFERPLPPVVPGGIRRRLKAAEVSDPWYTDYRGYGAIGGATTIGFLGGGGFDGGGGGGDGGGS
jgi:hypothetical protein